MKTETELNLSKLRNFESTKAFADDTLFSAYNCDCLFDDHYTYIVTIMMMQLVSCSVHMTVVLIFRSVAASLAFLVGAGQK